jgi:hypothetical protein
MLVTMCMRLLDTSPSLLQGALGPPRRKRVLHQRARPVRPPGCALDRRLAPRGRGVAQRHHLRVDVLPVRLSVAAAFFGAGSSQYELWNTSLSLTAHRCPICTGSVGDQSLQTTHMHFVSRANADLHWLRWSQLVTFSSFVGACSCS